MKLTLLQEKKQPLLLRKELVYTLDYPQASTPSKDAVMKLLTGQLKIDEHLLVLEIIRPTFGISRAQVVVIVYDTKEALQKFSGVTKKKAPPVKEGEKKEAVPVAQQEEKKEAPKVEEKKETASPEEKKE